VECKALYSVALYINEKELTDGNITLRQLSMVDDCLLFREKMQQ
jgi:hypothetical protein